MFALAHRPQLNDYAARANTGSTNVVTRPHLVIIFNLAGDESEWDARAATALWMAEEESQPLREYYADVTVMFLPDLDSPAFVRQILAFQGVVRRVALVAAQARFASGLLLSPATWLRAVGNLVDRFRDPNVRWRCLFLFYFFILMRRGWGSVSLVP